jgi:SAM-dependent methyltransferase/predicted O-methyltransferase YrrM
MYSRMNRVLDAFARPICLDLPRRLTPLSAWHEHIPFVLDLVAAMKPRVIVELGTHAGDSYCAMCQAVATEGLATRCYAVDTWEGDPQAGHYGPEILADLRAHHDPLYGAFSQLVQSTFQGALDRFAPRSIDLLHIDGLHTYEAVRDDFEAWLPKVSASGVVLLHDVCVRDGDFGVWRLWDEIKARHPSFEFTHGCGLGVVAVGAERPAAVAALVDASEEDVAVVQRFFHELGSRLTVSEALRREREATGILRAAVADRDRQLVDRGHQLADRDTRIADLERQMKAIETRLTEAVARCRASEAQIEERDSRLNAIQSSRGYRALTKARLLRDAVLPRGSARRDLAARVLGRTRQVVEPVDAPLPARDGTFVRMEQGHCPVCDRDTRFTATDPWLRDHYRCESCGCIPRERALAAVLRSRFPEWQRLRVHESSPGTTLSRCLAASCPGYVATHYFPDAPGGTIRDGYRCEDLERQTFPDEVFDLVITLDVMEHLFDWEAAFREIARTLAPGGAHLFTTPKYPELRRSEVQAMRRLEGIEHLREPEFHHNPIDPQGSLVTVHWGDDIGDIVQRASGLTTTTYQLYDPRRGLEGELLDVFVSSKPAN